MLSWSFDDQRNQMANPFPFMPGRKSNIPLVRLLNGINFLLNLECKRLEDVEIEVFLREDRTANWQMLKWAKEGVLRRRNSRSKSLKLGRSSYVSVQFDSSVTSQMICIIHSKTCFLLKKQKQRNYYRNSILATIWAHDILLSNETTIDESNLDYEWTFDFSSRGIFFRSQTSRT